MDLTITAIETEQIRVPLVRTYRGSHYKMTHRLNLICHRVLKLNNLFILLLRNLLILLQSNLSF